MVFLAGMGGFLAAMAAFLTGMWVGSRGRNPLRPTGNTHRVTETAEQKAAREFYNFLHYTGDSMPGAEERM